jgi:hypothetical protein
VRDELKRPKPWGFGRLFLSDRSGTAGYAGGAFLEGYENCWEDSPGVAILQRYGVGSPRVKSSSVQDDLKGVEKASPDQGCAGDRQYPGPNDAAGNAPADGGKTVCGADADDSAGDGMRGADGDAEMRGGEKCDCACGFGGEPTEGR